MTVLYCTELLVLGAMKHQVLIGYINNTYVINFSHISSPYLILRDLYTDMEQLAICLHISVISTCHLTHLESVMMMLLEMI